MTITDLDWHPLWVTMRVALSATAVSLVAGSLIGYWLSQTNVPGKRWFIAASVLPLVMPPTVLGFYLLVLIGRRGPIGAAWEAIFGGPLILTAKAATIAACVSTIPIVVRQMTAAFSTVEHEIVEAARIDGATPMALLAHIYLPLVRPVFVAAGTIAFARAVGDFGTTLMVAGNIPGKTQTVSIAIYDLMNAGKDGEAFVYVAIVTILSLLILVLTSGREAREKTA